MQISSDPQKLRSTLDDLKRRIQQEREAAETLSAHLTAQRDQNRVAEESRVMKLESELTAAQKQLSEQKEVLEREKQQLAAGRDNAQSLLRKLQVELAAAEARHREEREAAGELVQRIAAERDEARARMSEIESRVRTLEESLAESQRQQAEQRQATVALVEQLTMERDKARAQLSEVEARTRAVEEEIAAAQGQFQEETSKARVATEGSASLLAESGAEPGELSWRMAVPLTLVLVSATDLLTVSFPSDPKMLEAVREIRQQSQKLLEVVRGHDRPALSGNPTGEPGNPPASTT